MLELPNFGHMTSAIEFESRDKIFSSAGPTFFNHMREIFYIM